MPRKKKDPEIRASMCARMIAIMGLVGRDDSELSELLGYANQTTISKMRRHHAFLDTEPLARFGVLPVRNCGCPNLHWILTGEGEPFIPSHAGISKPETIAAMNRLVMDQLGSFK